MDLGRFGHLTYSTLVHPGDTWDEMWDSLTRYVPKVKARVCPDAPFGVSLRLSAVSAQRLTDEPQERAKLKAFLDANDMYLYTVNAFPYGPFKNQLIKEQVYEPDWRTEQRISYTLQVAEILAEVAGAHVNPSIQSPPLGFKPNGSNDAVLEEFAGSVRAMAIGLHRIFERTGRIVTLALEPEPYCVLETTEEAIAFFARLRSPTSIGALAGELGVDAAEARKILDRHIGVVFDICHQAVEYENIKGALRALVAADVKIFKLQEAAAVMIEEVNDEAVEALRPYADTVYLTQTVERRNGKLTRFLNLEDAFAAYQADPGPREWRIHFHVPVFLERLGHHFRTTRFAIQDALAVHKETPLSDQLEIETYTWDVLPEELKTGDIVDYVSREIEWVRSELA